MERLQRQDLSDDSLQQSRILIPGPGQPSPGEEELLPLENAGIYQELEFREPATAKRPLKSRTIDRTEPASSVIFPSGPAPSPPEGEW